MSTSVHSVLQARPAKSNAGIVLTTKIIPMPALPATPGTPLSVDPHLPSDPVLRKIALDVLAEAKYAFAVIASGSTPGGPAGGFGPIVGKFLASRRAKPRDAYQTYARMHLDAPTSVKEKHFGQYTNITPTRYAALVADDVTQMRKAIVTSLQIQSAIAAAADTLNTLFKAQRQFFPISNVVADTIPLPPDLQEGLKYKTIEFFINSVYCFDETSGVLEGSDEINMGGTIVDPVGNTTEIGEFVVSDDFNQGDAVDYPGGRQFGSYTINTKSPWPHQYVATVVLAEKDNGGFADFLNQLWAQIRDKVTAAVAAAGGIAAGAVLGTALGGIIGAAIGAIVGLLIGWIISLFDNPDDIVGIRNATFTLATFTKSYYDWAKITSPGGYTFNLDFQDDGHYQVNCGFRLVNP